MKVTGRLENWSWDNGHECFWGELYDDIHQRWPDGSRIHTSYTKDRDSKEGDIVKTLDSFYLLGKPYKEADIV